jgi:hypothetical protein
MKAVNVARVLLVVGAAVAAAASTTTNKKTQGPAQSASGAPQPTQMDPAMAMGLWKSSFGAVKVESDNRGAFGAVHGVWVYDRSGQEVVGYFAGPLNGNVLEFTWTEPAADGTALQGAGYLVFDPYGQKFSGKWWTNARDRQGEWTGLRAPATTTPPPVTDDYQPPPTNY